MKSKITWIIIAIYIFNFIIAIMFVTAASNENVHSLLDITFWGVRLGKILARSSWIFIYTTFAASIIISVVFFKKIFKDIVNKKWSSISSFSILTYVIYFILVILGLMKIMSWGVALAAAIIISPLVLIIQILVLKKLKKNDVNKTR